MRNEFEEYKLTAYLLGELDEKERVQVEQILEESPSARRQLDELREAIGLLEDGIHQETMAGPRETLTGEQHRVLEQRAAANRPVVVRFAGAYWFPMSVAASLILVSTLAYMLVFQRPRVETGKSPAMEQASVRPDEKPPIPSGAGGQQDSGRQAAGSRQRAANPADSGTAGQQGEGSRLRTSEKQDTGTASSAPAAPGSTDMSVPPPPAVAENGDQVREEVLLMPENRLERTARQAAARKGEEKASALPPAVPAPRPQSPVFTLRDSTVQTQVMSGMITGLVKDQMGGVIPGAWVKARVPHGGRVMGSDATDANGWFTISGLAQGSYIVEAEMPGFQIASAGPLTTGPGLPAKTDLVLQVGEVSSTMAVQGSVRNRLPSPVNRPRYIGTPESTEPRKSKAARVDEVRARQRAVRPREFNTESYAYFADNRFVGVREDPLSTFSIDVDTASYSNMRRFISNGQLPPADAVRIEELVNYFEYEYAGPTGNHPIAAHVEVARPFWEPAHRLVRIAIKGKDIRPAERQPLNLVFLIDVSGSMQPEEKLPLLKNGLRMLVRQLDERDRIGIVTYAGDSRVVLQSASGANRERILTAIDELSAGGSTNGGAGIATAYEQVREYFDGGAINRVILATDGDFNVGMTNQGDLVRYVQDQAKAGVYLTVLGFGTGNYKDQMLETLADKGNGNYAYIDDATEARRVLVEQMGGTLLPIAKDVKIQVEFNPSLVAAYRLIGYENRAMAHEDFADDTKDAGELGAGHTVTALYQLVPYGVAFESPGVEPLKYQKPKPAPAGASRELLTVKIRYQISSGGASRRMEIPVMDDARTFEHASEDFRFAASVASFGMMLRNSPFKGNATMESIADHVRGSLGPDPKGYRNEFLRLVERARMIGER